MANNLIQIKRSLNTANPGSLANGELAYTANGDVLFIGSNGQLKAIGGARTPGTLTANQALVANNTGGIDKVIAANVVPGQVYANGSHGSVNQLLASGGPGTNVFWYTPPAGVVGVNTAIQFNDSGTLNALAAFTFNKDNNTLLVGNNSGNVAANASGIYFGGTLSLNSTAYLGTAYNANNTTYVNNKAEINLNVNNALTSNNASYLGGTIAAAYVQNTDSRVLSGNLNFSAANNYFDVGLRIGANLSINTTAIYTGNTTSNLSVNSQIIAISNTSSSANLTPQGLRVGSVTVNSTSVYAVDGVFTGNLTVEGTMTTVDSVSLQVKDSLIKLADQQTTTDALSIGFYGVYGNSTSTNYAGLFRDQGDGGIWKLFHSDAEPDTTVNTSDPSYQQQTLQAYLKAGGFVSNSTAIRITANSTVSAQLVANSLTLTSPLNTTSGGTGVGSYTAGDITYYASGTSLTKLGLGSDGYLLQVNSSSVAPYWGSLDGGIF